MSWLQGSMHRWSARSLRLALASGLALAGTGGLATTAIAGSGPGSNASAKYSFQKLDDPADTTFNQLLGINKAGTISGYYGSGLRGHPNKGFTLPNDGRGHHFKPENFPHSVQTQVVGLNDRGVTVGFYSSKMGLKGPDFGFYTKNGAFHQADFPTKHPAKPAVDQLLGVNDSDIAVGFYNTKNNTHAYSYDIKTHKYAKISVRGVKNVTAAAINNNGDVAGFGTVSGKTVGFLRLNHGKVFTLKIAGADMTQAFGVNDADEVVGAYTKGANSYGFVWSPGLGFQTINDPHGVGSTVINGINDHDRIVGFYTDSANNTDGFLGTPKP
jgi:hypothetical protein